MKGEMKKTKRRILSFLLTLAMLIPQTGLTAAAADGSVEASFTITHKQTGGGANSFTFAEGKWEDGDESHTWSKKVDTSNPEATYYEVKFTGHKIDVYEGKNRMMGYVRHKIDGQKVGEEYYDLYNSSNINSTKIATYDNLSEGEHVLRVEATGGHNDATDMNLGILIDAAQVVVYYNVAAKDIHGTIVDSNLQYTQDKYSDLMQQDKKAETLNAWKNDVAVSQLSILAGGKKLEDVTLEASDLTGTNGTISKDHVTATFIKSVQAYNGAYPGYGNPTKPVPTGSRVEANEVLYQTEPIDIEAGKLQNAWVSIEVPEDAEAGTYTGTLTASAKGVSEELVFTYTVEVADAVLADEEDFRDSFDIELWQNPFASAEYYDVTPFSEEHFKILKPHMEKYKSIGGHTVTASIVDDAWDGQTYSKNAVKFPSMIKWTKKTSGKWEFDYTNFDKWIQFNKDLGIGDKIVCYSIAPWNNQITWYDEKTKTQKITAKADGNYMALWRTFLEDLMRHMEAKGWKEGTYIGFDERGFSLPAFDLVDSVLGEDGKPFMIAGAMDHFVQKQDMALRLDVLSVGSTAIKDNAEQFEALRQKREAAGLRTTVYTCTEHRPGTFSLSAPGESYWTILYSYSVGGEGYMKWAYDSWVEDPLRDTTHNAFEAGDCFLIFPDEKDAADPVSKSSLRLEKMAEGVRDVNKLYQIKKEVPALETEVAALLDTLKPRYADDNRSYLTEAAKVELAADMDQIKQKIGDLTDKYIEKKKTDSSTVSSINIDGSAQISMKIGETKQLRAKFSPDNLLNTSVTWSSSDPLTASVSSQGLVTANKSGTATITAASVQDPSKTAQVAVTIARAEISTTGQYAYYPFDGDASDKWGSRNGTAASGVTYAEGKNGKAVKVTPDNKVTLPNNTTLNTTWSVGYWVYQESSASGRVSVLTDSQSILSFDNQISDSNAGMGVHVENKDGGHLTFSSYKVPLGTWTHLMWTNDKTNGLNLYVNGVLKENNAWTKTNNFLAPVDIVGGTGFTGMIDELKIYDRALTAEEVRASILTAGLNVAETDVSVIMGETYQIQTDLVSENTDRTVTFTSSNPSVASVDSKGLIMARKTGTAVITVANSAGGYTEKVTVRVTKKLMLQRSIWQYELPEDKLMDIEKDEGGDHQYLGQPDLVMLDDEKTVITTYPVGHGCGPLVMKVSKDGGNTWTEKTDIPKSWEGSYETPTLYKLDMTDGSTKLILITGRPQWHGNTQGGWQTSISDDGGENWTEYKTYHPTLQDGTQNWTTVAMASLIQLHDENGKPIDKWMGVYHNASYVNYKTYLTFDKDGKEQWSEPEPYLSEYRDIELSRQICEVGMFRSPDGRRIVALARTQTHQHKSVMFYSDDEGETWSKPEELQGALQGERHKAVYDPISGRLLVTFREIILDLNQDGYIQSGDWVAGDWVAWVGTYEDLMQQNEGQYRILLDEDWANNEKSGDTGYAGIAVKKDGTFIMDSYGHWDKEFSQSWSGGVTTDLCYIRLAKFKLGEVEQLWGLIDKSGLEETVGKCKLSSGVTYSQESKKVYDAALAEAQALLADPAAQQSQIDAAEKKLRIAWYDLVPESGNALPYTDVPNAWYYRWIYSSYVRGLMTGKGDGTIFDPNGSLIRAEFATVLYRIAGSPYAGKDITWTPRFDDVKDVSNRTLYYVDPIMWGSENGIINGYGNNKFGPMDKVTRAQIAVMLYRYAKANGNDVSARADLKAYRDEKQIQNDEMRDAISWCVAEKIMEGQENGTKLAPQGYATRAECATLITRFVKAFE